MGKKSTEAELLAFGLLLFKPRIQYNYNDENIINSKAFYELKNCYNNHEKEISNSIVWDKDNNIYDKHEAAKLVIYHNRKFIRKILFYFDMNDSFNQYGKLYYM
ncbi:hypothetical protein RFI_25271 [Reticulomyxa filosa]|uniref:Uncharacterized protein n=1 Tax=Reticulomyxa filosa TaxID=46433 RepID=X6MEK6_RETFI|nr:hypothetical protein RFI_25271 [Reticulomyxa filosa]|eukprot:ETO12106.1 hypothetical protein RFI_25271 [Reticulomyxa filosa]